MKRKMPMLNALKVFEVAASFGNFTRAAEVLSVTQSAVSRQVRQLEDQLGETLLERHHHHLHLTPAGRLLLKALQQSFDGIELTVRAIQQKQHLNRLRVNAPPTFAMRWLVPRLGSLRERHPELEITVTSALQDTLVESGQLDCAIRFGNGEWDNLESSLLLHEQHIAVCAPSLLKGRAHDQLDLSHLTLLHVLSRQNKRYMTWQHWLDASGISGIDLRGGYEFDLLDMAIRAATAGLGVAIVDRHVVAQELSDGRLVQWLDVQVEGHQSYWFVTRPEQMLSPAAEKFRVWLLQEVAACDRSMTHLREPARPGQRWSVARDGETHHSFFE
ncbi:LysR substrate-binding domain-containing protein [Dyella mobilis]|uniref:LysR family transcriptional regulator n=1 Tax=Dyella mobilis TaxID=1849582 RepID=A0ABS2KKT2_9GAMM|nr:LysR substrate-binding domain-containing protein [Dyella mobilis]MBM7131630.1 LysR family transcriptional regulator [Dyella mobilis]GLQ96394.1 LysR family transcriptional regulator [Dyella mobilis]